MINDHRAFIIFATAAFMIGFGLIGMIVGKPVSHSVTVPVVTSAPAKSYDQMSDSEKSNAVWRHMESLGVDPAQQFNVINNLLRRSSGR